ncbi:MAG: hypothetical protein ACMG6E_02845 [Candidatus Roizmanbacteria bacterium]
MSHQDEITINGGKDEQQKQDLSQQWNDQNMAFNQANQEDQFIRQSNDPSP